MPAHSSVPLLHDVDRSFEKELVWLRETFWSAAREVVDERRAGRVAETLTALVRTRLDNASSIRDWHRTVGQQQTAATLNQLYEDVGGWDEVLSQVLGKIRLTLERVETGVAIVDDTSFRKYGMEMEGLSSVHCANIKSPVPGHNAVTLMLADGAEGVFADLKLKVNRSRPKHARRPGRLREQVREARDQNKRELALQMIEQAKANGVELRLVLFDAWYFCAEMAECLNDLDLALVSRAKSNTTFIVDGREMSAKDFLASCSTRKRVRSTDHCFYQRAASLKCGIEVKLVATWFFQGRGMVQKLAVLVTTDLAMSGPAVVLAYIDRWATEQGYKTLKHELAWANYHSTDFPTILVLLRIGLPAYALSRKIQNDLHERIPLPTLLRLRRRARQTLAGSAEVPSVH